jgi:hypothetical protein
MFQDKCECSKCHGINWICEMHPDKLWGGAASSEQLRRLTNLCLCPGPGKPCDECGGDFENRPHVGS